MFPEDIEEVEYDLAGVEPAEVEQYCDSTKRKRRTKMNRHKYRKRLKKNRFLRRSLGK